MERVHTLAIQATSDPRFIGEVERASGQQISHCYQCGNCSASCAYTYVYDYPANQIMRLVQLGQKDIVLTSKAIWLCAACQACTTRCPCNIDVAKVMESLRVLSRQEKKVSGRDIQLFYDEFLKLVKRFGRVFETGLLPLFGMKAKKPFTDMDLAPRVIRKGKLGLIPHKVKGRKHVEGIFERFEAYCSRREKDKG
ncbi:MAG: heterodisulfide reductase subunit C [Deltaproteobacteria bacterium]|nr:heterodisulfide reductase subunit C [Deltaproteobacteria bacterium]